jgi:hypothetical protein
LFNSANVGLSLGHPTVMTSLCGKFTTFSKVVICAMMIRGRHRGLPYAVDRAVTLTGDLEREEGEEQRGGRTLEAAMNEASGSGSPGGSGGLNKGEKMPVVEGKSG